MFAAGTTKSVVPSAVNILPNALQGVVGVVLGTALAQIFEKYKTELSIRPKFFEMLDGENQQKYQQPSNKKN